MPGKSILALVVSAGAVALTVAPASAHDTTFPTEVFYEGVTGSQSDLLFFGHLRSERRACVEDRKVVLRIQQDPGDPFEKADEDRSSENGAFALRGDFEGASDGRIKAKERDLRSGGEHDHVCEGASVSTAG